MSSPLINHKKIILSLLLITLVIAGVFGAWHGVLAQQQQPPAAQPQAGNATPPSDLSYWYGAITAILEFIRALLAKILAIASYFLGVAFSANVSYLPAYDQIAQTGWVVMRDLMNGIFILLVLWIALTIILGIEQYGGGRKLLPKVLAVAVLINFSLAIVTAVVALSNQFTLAFYNKIFPPDGEKDLGALIIQFTQVQSVIKYLTVEERAALANSISTPPAQTPAQEQDCSKFTIKNIYTCSVFVRGFGTAAKSIVKAGGADLASAIGIPETTRLQALSVGIGVIVFFIMASAFVYAAIALWIRIFALMLLAIFAPVAMVAMILPVPIAREGWNKWQQEFFKWIFFAPVFYFLIYLSLLMANTMNNAIKQATPPGAVAFSDDVRLFLSYTIVIIMLIFAERFAKKSAGKAGEVTVGLAKKAAGLAVGVTAGVATGGTLMAARAVARGAAKEGGVAEKMAGSKFGRMVGGGALLRKGVQEREAQKTRIAEREKKYEHYSTSQMQAEVKGSTLIYSEENAARIAALAKKKDGFKGVSDTEMRTYENILSRYNQASVIAKVKPTMANEKTIGEKGREKIAEAGYGAPGVTTKETKAVQYAGENLSGKEIDDTLDVNELVGDDPKNKALRAGIVRNANLTQKRIEDLVQKNYSAAAKVVADMTDFVGQLDTQISTIDGQIAAGGTTEEIAALNVKKNDLQRQRAPKQAIMNNLRTTPGGRALGLAAPALTLTGSRIVTGTASSLIVDVKSRIRGGSGNYTFAPDPNTPLPAGFQLDTTGILSTDTAHPPAPNRYPISIRVVDTADPGNPTTITLNATVNP
ncbi:MAG: hypothetical protein HY617_00230 [Candidatus Sungbacteria bacterium]|nr:hypothetical protein [Candidatus Sungbacteria bacterium]